MTYNRWTSGRCRFCNEPLTDQEYHAGDEECRYAALERMRAALARAEAAEAEAARLKEAGRMVQEEVTAWRDSYEALNEQRLALAARVAELESQLAAQQWRPVTKEWPPYHERVIIGYGGGYGGGWSAFARRVRTDDRDDWLMDDDTTLAFETAAVAMQPPPHPVPQEPPQ